MKSKLYNSSSLESPTATKKPKKLTIHGDTRVDDYYWLNERENPEVINYLKEENQYVQKVMAHNAAFREELYREMVSRIKKDDQSVPYKKNGYYYSTHYESKNEYPIYKRGPKPAGDDEVLIDQNELASGYAYHAVRGLEVSPDNEKLIYGEDTLSRRIYTLKFKNLSTGTYYPDEIPNTSADAIWANDNKTVFYTVKDETLRPCKVFRHTLGSDIRDDVLIYHEKDPTYLVFLNRSKSGKYLMIGSYSTLSTEYRILEADNPNGKFRLFQPRIRKLEYEIEHFEDKFYVLTNHNAMNFKIAETPEEKTSLEFWTDVVPHREEVLVEDMDVFKNYLVLSERQKGISKIHVLTHSASDHFVEFEERVYTASTTRNYDFNTDVLRLSYTSLKTPPTVYDYNMKAGKLNLLKQTEVLGSFDSDNYETIQIQAPARDGKMIPVSLVYKKGILENGGAPMWLTGYGSYGHSYDPYFSSVRLSLLDRGFIFGIAHIRGGEELGRAWYEDGKMFNKKNTFTDFIDCAEHLIAEGIVDSDQLYINGGSAGGLLMGAVTNMRPDLWAGVVLDVPFVDVVTTMLDESIPLTTGEYDEWGNPNDSASYIYIKSYSPYDNIEAQQYPPILVTTGLHDSQVQYWEPAKYVAKLRELKTDNNPLLFHTDLEAGHGGASGRFASLKERAMQYAFVLDLAGRM